MSLEHPPLQLAGMAMMSTMRAILTQVSIETGFSRQQLMALHAVEMSEPQGARVSDVAESIVNSASAASRTVDGLVEQGLITRVTDPDDRRVQRLRLTEEGRARVSVATRVTDAIMAEASDGIGADRLSEMAETMQLFAGLAIAAVERRT